MKPVCGPLVCGQLDTAAAEARVRGPWGQEGGCGLWQGWQHSVLGPARPPACQPASQPVEWSVPSKVPFCTPVSGNSLTCQLALH